MYHICITSVESLSFFTKRRRTDTWRVLKCPTVMKRRTNEGLSSLIIWLETLSLGSAVIWMERGTSLIQSPKPFLETIPSHSEPKFDNNSATVWCACFRYHGKWEKQRWPIGDKWVGDLKRKLQFYTTWCLASGTRRKKMSKHIHWT